MVSGKRDPELKDQKALLIGSKAHMCEGNRAEQVRASGTGSELVEVCWLRSLIAETARS